eukprot:scaffold320181_cov32-Tisochrysis_lutea.AAC.1
MVWPPGVDTTVAWRGAAVGARPRCPPLGGPRGSTRARGDNSLNVPEGAAGESVHTDSSRPAASAAISSSWAKVAHGSTCNLSVSPDGLRSRSSMPVISSLASNPAP